MNETATVTTTTDTTLIVTKNEPKHKKYRKGNNSYRVTDQILLYRIADAGILYEYLHGVNKDKNGNKIFHFDKHIEIKEIIDHFKKSKESENLK